MTALMHLFSTAAIHLESLFAIIMLMVVIELMNKVEIVQKLMVHVTGATFNSALDAVKGVRLPSPVQVGARLQSAAGAQLAAGRAQLAAGRAQLTRVTAKAPAQPQVNV